MPASVEERLAKVESDIAAIMAVLGPRQATAEANAKAASGGKDGWDKAGILIQLVGPIVAGLVIWYVGFAVKDSVDIALHRQEVEISSASEMQALIGKLQEPDIGEADAKAAALALAAFGLPAANILIFELQTGNASTRSGAQVGLGLLVMGHPEPVCEIFRWLIDEGRRYYSWPTHQAVIELIGRGRCLQARMALVRFQALVPDSTSDTLAKFAGEIAADPPPSVSGVEDIRAAIDASLMALGGTKPAGSPLDGLSPSQACLWPLRCFSSRPSWIPPRPWPR